MHDWFIGVVLLLLLFIIVKLSHEPPKPTNEQVAACVLSCKGHLTDMIEYHSYDIAKDGNFTCHCYMAFKISKDGSNITDLQ